MPIKGEKTEEKKVTHNHDPDAPNALTLYRAPKFEKCVLPLPPHRLATSVGLC